MLPTPLSPSASEEWLSKVQSHVSMIDLLTRATGEQRKRPVRTVAYDGRFRDEGREVGMAESGWIGEWLLFADSAAKDRFDRT